MKKLFLFSLFLALLTVVSLITVSASDAVAFVSGDGTGDGKSADAPAATMDAAYALLGDEGGTIVICGAYTVGNTSTIQLPSHTGTVTITSVYGDIDYRGAGATLLFNGTSFAAFNGPTVFDGITMTVAKNAAGICMNFNDLTIGYDVEIAQAAGGTGYYMYLIGGPNNNASISPLAKDDIFEMSIYSGKYHTMSGFSRSNSNASHLGTAIVNIGGDADISAFCGGPLSTGAKGGTVIVNMQENAKIVTMYLGGYNCAAMNGDATINMQGNTSIGTIKNYDDSFFPNSTSTLNYTSTVSLPSGFAACFDAVTQTDIVSGDLDTVYVANDGAGDGTAADKPIDSLANAYALLGENGGTIVLVGDTTVSNDLTFTECTEDVSFRAENDAKLIFSGSIAFAKNTNGKAVTLDLPIEATDAVIYGGFRNVTFGESCTITGTLDFYGGTLSSSEEDADNASVITDLPYTITVKNGTFRHFAGGICRATYTDMVGSVAATLTVNISNGSFTDSFSLSGGSILADDVNLTISNGKFTCPIYVRSVNLSTQAKAARLSPTVTSDRSYYAMDGDVTIDISGGSFTGGLISAYDTSVAYTQLLRGNFTVNITGGSFAEDTVLDATQVKAYKGVTNKIASLTYPNNYTFTVKRFNSVNGKAVTYDEPLRVAFVGDSITEGAAASAPLTTSYPAVFAALAAENGREIVTANYGISASGILPTTSVYYPDRLAYPLLLEETDADYIVLTGFGTNDNAAAIRNGLREAYIERYTAFVETLGALPETDKVFLTNSIVGGTQAIPGTAHFRMRSVIQPLQERMALAFLAQDAEKYIFVDMYGLMLPVAKAGNLLSGDRTHPKDSGYAAMGKAIYDAIFNGVTAPETDYHRTVIYLSEDGTEFGSGTEKDPVSRLDLALAMIPEGADATVYISGTISHASSIISPIKAAKLTFVGKGTDATLSQTDGDSFWINSDIKFDNLTLETTVKSSIVANYYNVEMTESVTLVGDWSFYAGICSYNTATAVIPHDTVASVSSDKDCTITLSGSGSFTNFLLGNYRVMAVSPIGTYSGTLTATVGDGYSVSGNAGAVGQNYLTGSVSASLPYNIVCADYASIGKVSDPIVYDAEQNIGTVTVTNRAAADDVDVVFVADSGTGNGRTASAPTSDLAAAYALLGEDGGTVVFTGDFTISKIVDFPAHTGTVTLTSLYGGVDYRETNGAALHYDAAISVRLNGPTVIDNFNVEIDTTGAVLAANFHDLTIGTDVEILKMDGGTGYYMYLIGGQNNASDDRILSTGDTVNITVSSGKYICVTGFSRLAQNISHTGTANIRVGGTADVRDLYLGCLSAGARGGTAVLTLGDSASVQTMYLSGGSAGMNGDATVNISGSASIGNFKNYDKDTYFANGTRTLHATGTPTLPTNYEDCFDVTNVNIETIEYDTVYLSGSGSGNGLTPDTPVNTLTEAYNKLTDGGTIVVVGEVNMVRTEAPAHKSAVTITSVYDGVDYRENGAKLVFPATSVTYLLGGETVFKDVTIDMTAAGVLAACFHPLTFDTGVTVNADYTTDANGLFVVGGDTLGTFTEGIAYDKDTQITVRSGSISRLVAFSRYSGARAHTGTATITIENDAHVRYLFTGSCGNTSSANKAVIHLKDTVLIENLIIGGAESNNPMTGEVVINVDEMNGGIIQEIDVMSLYNNKGGVTLNYNKSCVPDGLLFLADLAKFDKIQTVCERDGTHIFGEAQTNPFDTQMQIRICSACGHTEVLSELPDTSYESVAFVADGGFGDGSHPALPLGSYKDAMNALGNEGGTIVLVGETTLATNWSYKLGSDPAFFQEPAHAGTILVTSIYSDVDYRENGAKLIFNGDMHYKLSGDTTFDGIVFDATEDATSNIMAARYNKLVFGEDVKMQKTIADGYSLGIVGGYQYFRYTDFVDVYIADEYLRFSSHAVGVDTFALPDSKTIDIDVATGDTAPAYLRKAAAEAFDAMFAAMAAEGLEMPTITSGMQTYEFKYDYITRFFARTWRAHPDWTWDRVFTYVTKSTGLPGYSEHHLGLAVDMYDVTPDFETDSPNHDYDKTKEWAWIQEHGKEYGIILRYPDNGTSAVTGFITEAWHFRYVGVEHATAIMDATYKLLEYYVGKHIGLFDQDSDVTLLGGTYDFVLGGSRDCENEDVTFTGEENVVIGTNATVGESAEDVTLLGDANGDGKVSLLDILCVLKYSVNETVDISATADYNEDGNTNIADALLILKAILNG